MNTEQMRNFEVAYRTHNFAAAARAIPMSAQGFVKSIRTLEAELGVLLFEQDAQTGAQVPTPYADELLTYVNAVQAQFAVTKRAFERIDAERNGRVRLAASLGIMGLLGSDFMEALEASCPEIHLSYAEMSDRQCDDQLAEESFGIGFTLAPYDSAFETVEVYSTPVCLWVNEKDPLAHKQSVSIGDLDGRILAIPGKEFKCYNNIVSRCRSEGVQPKVVLKSSEMFWLYNFVYENHGLAFSAEHLGRLPFFAGNGVKCIPLDGIFWRFGISTLPKHRFSDAERRFRKFCLRYFSERFTPAE